MGWSLGAWLLVSVALSAGSVVGETGRRAVAETAPPGRARSISGAPNVVLILSDDQRWDSLWSMPSVQADLVQHGVTFSNAFVVNSLCCPSRATVLAGQYSHSTGVYKNTPPNGGFGSFKDASTVATWLHDAGYRTALVGKYLNGYTSAATIPPGWDRWVAYTSNRGDGDYYNYTLSVDGTSASYGSDPQDYATDVLASEAESFIRGADASQPIFLYFAPKGPHAPATPAPRDASDFSDLSPYRPPNYNEPDVSDKPEYVQDLASMNTASMAYTDSFRINQYRTLESVDDAVGGIVQALTDTSRLSNTLLVFASDNGFSWGEHRWSINKLVPYEESIRVPMVVRDDALGIAPRNDDHLVLNLDLAPTFAEAAGVTDPGAEGSSLLPLLQDPSTQWRMDFLVEHEEGEDVVPTYCEVRNEGYAYVAYITGEEELYDLGADPYELLNVAGDPSYASTREAMRARLGELCTPPPPPIYLAQPPVVVIGRPFTLTGLLGFPLDGGLAGETIHASRANPDGSQSTLPDSVTGTGGAIAVADDVDTEGTYTYTITWDGDDVHQAQSETISLAASVGLPSTDFNGDGISDLAVGVPGESVGTVAGAGGVNVIYGASGGLNATGNQFWSQNSPDVEDSAEAGDAFGSALAAGDFNGDGYADLAVGVPKEDLNGRADVGGVNVIYGSSLGLTASGDQFWSQDSPGILNAAEAGDRFGASLAAGDFNGDGFADLAVGVPYEDPPTDVGSVNVLYGSGAGLTSTSNQIWSQDSPGILDTGESGDHYGASLAAGDINGDGMSDLAVGTPGEDVGSTRTDAGSANVIYGSSAGLSSAGNQFWNQDSTGILNAAEVGDQFGFALTLGDFNGDGFDDLAAGVPYEDPVTDVGAVSVIYGSAFGLSSLGNQIWSQDSSGILDTGETGDHFGWSLSTGDINGDGVADLAVGVPSEDVGTVADAGAVNVIYGSGGELTTIDNQFWTQTSTGLDTSEKGDQFGFSVGVFDVGNTSEADLVIGAPFEDIGTGKADAGGLNSLYGGTAGLSTTGHQFWKQDTVSILDDSETGDQFGYAIAVAEDPPSPPQEA